MVIRAILHGAGGYTEKEDRLRSCFRNSVSHESDGVPPLIRRGQEGFAAVAFVYSHFYRRQTPLIPPLSGGKLVPETFQAEISLIFKTASKQIRFTLDFYREAS
jgi:hypothetical protein